MIADVIESLIPTLRSEVAELQYLSTKAAPKALSHNACDMMRSTALSYSVLVVHVVCTLEMLGEDFFAVKELHARLFHRTIVLNNPLGFAALPSVYLEMLRILVTFPVVLAAEGFGASRECTAIEAFVALLVLPVISLSAVAWPKIIMMLTLMPIVVEGLLGNICI